MNDQQYFRKGFSTLFLLVVLTACSKQTVILSTEMPVPVSASALIPITITPSLSLSPTQSIAFLAETSTPTNTPFFNSTGQNGLPSLEQQEEIKSIIKSYFEMRYQALSFPQPNGFQLNEIGELVSSESDARAFLDNELAKLALQIKYGELNGSRYVSYKYFLDFREFSFDTASELVSVMIIEDNETTTGNSSLAAQMSGLKHVIVLRKEQDKWKIVSDYYNDFLWRNIRQKGETKDDMLNMISTIESLITPSSTP